MTKEKSGKDKHDSESGMICPECGGTNINHDYDSGEDACGNCGTVLPGVHFDRGPEWRAYTIEEESIKSRAGAPTTYAIHDEGLTTVIGPLNRRQHLTPKQIRNLYKLRIWQQRMRVQTSRERTLSSGLSEMEKLADSLNLPKHVLETGAVNYRKALRNNLVRGRSKEIVSVASLYAACRQIGVARSLKDIVIASKLHKNDITRVYRLMVRKFETDVPSPDYMRHASGIYNKMGIFGKEEAIVIKLMKASRDKHLLDGKCPQGLGAAATYIATVLTRGCNLGRCWTQKEIADIAGVTEVTVRNRYKEMMEKLWITNTL